MSSLGTLSMNRRWLGGVAALALVAGSAWAGAAPAAELVVDHIMEQDPVLTLPPTEIRYSAKLKPLWLQALARPDAELRRLAAGTIAIAARRGMPGLEDTVAPLLDTLAQDQDPAVRRAAAQALVTLDAKDAAKALATAAERDGQLMAQIVEPALAKWKYEPIVATWRTRLESTQTPRQLRLLAIEALGAIADGASAERLSTITSNRNDEPPLRLAAARSLGLAKDSGLAELATKLSGGAGQAGMFERLLAVQLLTRHTDAATVELLTKLAADDQPSVATPALERLYTVNKPAALPIAVRSLQSGDAGLRTVAARMVAGEQNVDAVRQLQPLLADRNPKLRRYVASTFADFGAREELKPVVLEETMKMLEGSAWRGLEQAALVLGTLDHKPAAPRLLALLPHERGEAAIAAAWALRKLRIKETLPDVLKYAKSVALTSDTGPHIGPQTSQMFQMFGDLRYKPAENLMRQFVPKSGRDENVRGAACWALGCIYENKPDCDLAPIFAERLADVAGSPAEFPSVRRMTAIGLGRMKAQAHLDVLRKFAQMDSAYAITGQACLWSIEQLTGEKAAPAPPTIQGVAGWFLEPSSD